MNDGRSDPERSPKDEGNQTMSTEPNESLPAVRATAPNYPMAIAGAIGGAVIGYIGFS